jgi:hypothetical protein
MTLRGEYEVVEGTAKLTPRRSPRYSVAAKNYLR